jgi:hypothetical protein
MVILPNKAAFIADAISWGEAPASARVAATVSAISKRSSIDPAAENMETTFFNGKAKEVLLKGKNQYS